MTRKDTTVKYNNIGGHDVHKWKPPDEGVLKLNVDVSVYPEASSFGIGMPYRNFY